MEYMSLGSLKHLNALLDLRNANQTPVVLTMVSTNLDYVSGSMLHDLVAVQTISYEDLEVVASAFGESTDEVANYAESVTQTEDDQFVLAIARSLLKTAFTSLKQENNSMSWQAFLAFLQENSDSKTLLSRNPTFGERAIRLLAHAFARTLRDSQLKPEFADDDDPTLDLYQSFFRRDAARALLMPGLEIEEGHDDEE